MAHKIYLLYKYTVIKSALLNRNNNIHFTISTSRRLDIKIYDK